MHILQTARSAALTALLLFSPAQSLAAEFHVAPNGDDDAAGTKDAPFATVAAARNAVRRLIAGGLNESVRVILRGGTYRITEPIDFDPADSPGDKHTVTYAAAEGETVTISGGSAITGWTAASDGSWRVTLPEVKAGKWRFREMFVANARRPRAAHPNNGFARIVKAGADRRTSFTFNPADIPPAVTPEGTELLFLHDWSTTRVGVKAIDRNANVLTVTDPIGSSAPHYAIDHFEPNPRYRLENHPALLDAPGEWLLIEQTGELRYRPMPDEKLDGFVAVAPLAEALLRVRGEDGRPVRNLIFHRLRFEHCAWHTPRGGYAAGQAGFHEQRHGEGGNELRGLMPAAVTFDRAEHCRFERCRFAHLGGGAIWLRQQAHQCELLHCTFTDIAGNGVMIGEDRGRAVSGRPWWVAAPEQAARGNVIRDCLIDRCGALYFGCVGVWVGLARDTIIEHNDIHHLPYTGVSLGWMWSPTPTPCRGHRVRRNHIHHVMQVLSDGGGIYTLGRQPGTVLSENVIHNVPTNLGRAESNGMFLDEGTTELVIERNVIYNIARSPLRFHRAQQNLARRNALFTGRDIPIVRYNNTPAEHITLEENHVASQSEGYKTHPPVPEAFMPVLERAGRRAP